MSGETAERDPNGDEPGTKPAEKAEAKEETKKKAGEKEAEKAGEDEAAEAGRREAEPKAETKQKAKKEAADKPPRPLPSQDDIAAWAGGEEANVGILFEDLKLARFDALNNQLRNKELLPQHWQVITELHPPDDVEFERLPEVGRLRTLYKDQELARRRLANLKVAWRELRGRRPALWQVPDLMAALRRIIAKGHEVDFNELLAAARDVWLSSPNPAGKEHVEVLWACLSQIRQSTKK